MKAEALPEPVIQPNARARGSLWMVSLPLLIALWGFWQFRGFVQDDAYISLRYAANFAAGEGLVFNPGEAVEGFTNMLWTLLGSLFLFLGLPAIELWQVLGILASLSSITITFLLGLSLEGPLVGVGAAMLLAASTTLHAWSGAGLETALFTFFLAAALYEEHHARTTRAFALLGAAQWTRPEALMAAVALLYVKIRIDRAGGQSWRASLATRGSQFSAFLVPLLALLAIRWGYYGRLVPNTYLVKGAGVAANHQLGLHKLEKLLAFAGTQTVWVFLALGLHPPVKRDAWPSWLLVLFGGLTFVGIDVYLNSGGFWRPEWSVFKIGEILTRPEWDTFHTGVNGLLGGLGIYTLTLPRRLRERPLVAWMTCLWFGYLYYYVRVGGDLLPMHRLFMPALPAQSLLAALGAARLAASDGLIGGLIGDGEDPESLAERRGAAFALGAVACLAVLTASTQETLSNGHYRTVSEALDACHGQAGRDLQKIAEAGNFRPTAIAQDMGALPMEALGVNFLDAIGLTDRPVAEILWEYRYSPYYRYLVWEDSEVRRQFDEMEARLRTHLSEDRKPDYAVINAHLESADTASARRAAAIRDGDYFLPFLKDNAFFYKWTETAYFKENFVLLKAYEYSPVHFLVSYRRKDRPGLPDDPGSEDDPLSE